jgi:hypothetical protein
MKNRSRVIIMMAVLLIGILVWLPGLRSRQVAAQSAGLKGSYGFTQARLYAGDDNPAAVIGVVTFDGAGNATGSATSVQHDTEPMATTVHVQAAQFTGTYTVNADGTGTLAIPNPGGPTNTISFVITDGGSSLFFLQTGGGNNNNVVSGTARKQ